MIKRLGRIILRKNGDINKPDLIIGTCVHGQDFFKANDVYDINSILDEIVLQKRGESILSTNRDGFTWAKSVNDLLHMGKYIYLTTEEYKNLIKDEY